MIPPVVARLTLVSRSNLGGAVGDGNLHVEFNPSTSPQDRSERAGG